jgi:pimeloyl-ACP methyl ester carboxylesterase
MPRIESLLAARLFVAPQLVEGRLFFVSNLGGQLSLYVMDEGGSVPEPLLPPQIALQNPDLIDGYLFYVFPRLGAILIMLDHDGDELYQPMLIPIDGGFPEPAFGEELAHVRVACTEVDQERQIVYFSAESSEVQLTTTYQADLTSRTLRKLGESRWGGAVDVATEDHREAILIEGYTVGDHVLYRWSVDGGRQLLYGTPLEQRSPDETYPLSAIHGCEYTGRGNLLFVTALFEDTYGLGYLSLERPDRVRPVAVVGTVHTGNGEMVGLEYLRDDQYRVTYNIEGCSWSYQGRFDESALELRLESILCGAGQLANGVLESCFYDKGSDSFALSFSTATSPTQLYTVGGPDRAQIVRHTRERVLGIPASQLAPGEDASYTSWDGQRISARLYLPSEELGYSGPRPLVHYIHGGPQSQERPDFAWFSMPLIQLLTLRGFAVFVPNVRGSTGYGLSYTKRVDHDWGGDDRLDHVHALQVLALDPRVDTSRVGVIGRSYGGYMTLTLATRHPALWRAAVDMFGPYDLLSFMDRVPETWKPYFALAIGDPVQDRDFLIERSPSTYIEHIQCPMLVIQGKNDPRVIEQESREVVESLRASGKQVDYLMFENEGHDVLKLENRVRCYNAIADFFALHLGG